MGRQATIDALAAWLKERDDIVLIGHVNPDGDATGSCMAVMLALRAMGKRAFVCLPGGMARMYQIYPMAGEAVSPEDGLPFPPRTAFALDVSEENRMGGAKALFDACEHAAMLDHHDTNPGFGEIWRVEGHRAATGELALELIDALGVTLSPEMATWLFVAISTDSGHFRFSSTTRQTMEAGGRLIEAGADVARLTRQLWYTRTRARTQLMGKVLSGLETSPDGRMAWARLTNAMLEETRALREDNEGIVNYLLEIDGVEFAVLAEEREGGTKFSLRSKEWMDSSRVAVAFGGGGHKFAAGCTLALPMEEALTKVLAEGEKELRNGMMA